MKWLNSEKIRLLLVGLLLGVLFVSGSSVLANEFEGMRPIADAGSSRYAGASAVSLDGTRSYDPDNSGSLGYLWRQISGPSITITGADTPAPTVSGFVQTDEIQECEFELVVSDGELTSLPDTVKVIIVPDFGADTLQQENPPFDPDKPTVIYFQGGDCRIGHSERRWNSSAWNSRANVIGVPSGYRPDSDSTLTYYKYGDMFIVYLSSLAPDYQQPIQAIGFSTGGMPAIDVGIHMNLIYADARYAVNHVTLLDAPCRWSDSALPFKNAELFLTNAVDGEQCWMEEYYGPKYTSGVPHTYYIWPDELVVSLGLDHGGVRAWYQNSLTDNDMNKFNNGVVAGAYWSVIGPGKNLQLASQTDAYYFRWDGTRVSGAMSLFDEALHPGRLPEPVTLVGSEDSAVVDANGAVLTCQESENAVGYQLIFGSDPYHMVYLFSDTPNPPDEQVAIFPFEQTWWTVRAYDENGSTIHADPVDIKAESVITQTIENATTNQTYASIQQAVNDAHPGDEIVVNPGIYQYLENINFKGKNLTVRSTDPNDPAVVAATVINGGQKGSVITLSGGQGVDCVLAGLTITNGKIGISCRGASPTIQNCTVESHGPTAIDYWHGYEPTIIDCNILGQINETIDPSLAAHWRLDEIEGNTAGNTAGESVDNRDGTVYGNPLWQPDGGIVYGALQFDGIDDYISTPSFINPCQKYFSVFAWIQGGVPGQVVISQADGEDWLLADASEGTLRTELKSPGRSGRSLVSQTVITDGDWHRVGIVRDGSSRILYVDNVEVANDVQDSLNGSSGGLYIGAGKALEPGTFWSGLIDDVRIYNRAVTP